MIFLIKTELRRVLVIMFIYHKHASHYEIFQTLMVLPAPPQYHILEMFYRFLSTGVKTDQSYI